MFYFEEKFLEELKNQTATIADQLLTHSKDGKFICPFCGNGSGKDNTGVDINQPGNHCFVCGNSFNIFQAVQQQYHCNFNEAVKLCADAVNFNLQYDSLKTHSKNHLHNISPAEKLLTLNDDKEYYHRDLTPYYDACNKALFDYQKAVNYLKSRNLFDELLIDTYKIGYDPTINCIVIPHNNFYCTRRQITDDKKFRFIHNLKNAQTALFNADCVNNSEVIFITEGAIDALSIIKVGGSAIAIAGAAQKVNRIRLYKLINQLKNKPAIVILFDNDDSGNKQADEMLKELETLKIFGIKKNLPTQFNDSNEMLQRDAEALKNFVADSILEIEKASSLCYNKNEDNSNNTVGADFSFTILSNSSESVNKGAENMSDEIYSPSTNESQNVKVGGNSGVTRNYSPSTNESQNVKVGGALVGHYQKPKKEGFYTTDDVAKILGVDKRTVRRWRESKIFLEDIQDHNGVYWYSKERVEQLKSVYHKDWESIYRTKEEIKNDSANEEPNNADYINLPNLDLKLICPDNYEITLDGIFKKYWDEKKKQNKYIRICFSPIIISKFVENVDDNIFKTELSCYNKIKRRWIKVVDDNSAIFTPRCISALMKKGIEIGIKTSAFIEFLLEFKHVNIKNIPSVETINRIGWRDDDFILPGHSANYQLDDSISSQFQKKFQSNGDRSIVVELLKKIKQYPIANAIIGAALTAPMRQKVFDQNVAIQIAATSGSGKTAINTLAYSLFYNTQVPLPTFNGTRSGFEMIFSGMRDLPIFIDDLSNLSDKEHSLAEKMIYDYVNGIGRIRTDKNLSLPVPLQFFGSLLMSGEHFLTTDNSKAGAKTREMEFNAGRKYLPDSLSQEIYKTVKDNYGLFILDWINCIKKNLDNMKKTYQTLLFGGKFNGKTLDGFHKTFQGKIPRHINNIAAITTANIFFDAEFLGYHIFDAADIEIAYANTTIQMLPDMLDIVEYKRAKPIIRDFIISNMKKFVQEENYSDDQPSDSILQSDSFEMFGVIRKAYVGIIPKILDDFMISNGFSKLTISQLADDNFIIRNGKNLAAPFANFPTKGKMARMYKIPIQFIFEDMEK